MLGLKRRDNETQLARPQTSDLGRWDPLSEFSRLRSDMDSLFGSLFGQAPRLTGSISAFTPAVDLYETADEVVLNVYLPGMSREDIHVQVLGETIHISGESKPNVPEKDVTVHLAQGGFGRFDLRYTLPVEVKAQEVRAAYRNGVLEIRLPKAESARPQAVEVPIEG